MSTKTWTIEKCPCGHEACKDYHIPQLGMIQGGVLDLETATFIVKACNAHNDLVAALEALLIDSAAHINVPVSECVAGVLGDARKALAKAKGE